MIYRKLRFLNLDALLGDEPQDQSDRSHNNANNLKYISGWLVISPPKDAGNADQAVQKRKP